MYYFAICLSCSDKFCLYFFSMPFYFLLFSLDIFLRHSQTMPSINKEPFFVILCFLHNLVYLFLGIFLWSFFSRYFCWLFIVHYVPSLLPDLWFLSCKRKSENSMISKWVGASQKLTWRRVRHFFSIVSFQQIFDIPLFK